MHPRVGNKIKIGSHELRVGGWQRIKLTQNKFGVIILDDPTSSKRRDTMFPNYRKFLETLLQAKLASEVGAEEQQKAIVAVDAFLSSSQAEELHGHLTPREVMVMRRHFGLGQEKQETLAIASELRITRSRVEQIVAEGNRKACFLASKAFPLQKVLYDFGLVPEQPQALDPKYIAALKLQVQRGETVSDEDARKLIVRQFNLSTRTFNSLTRKELRTLFDLTRVTKLELLRFPNFGNFSLREVEALLAEFGLKLAE